MRYWIILGLSAVAVLGVGLWGNACYQAGRAAERQKAVERSNDLINKMEMDNAQISAMELRAKCAEFGFGWVREQGCVD